MALPESIDQLISQVRPEFQEEDNIDSQSIGFQIDERSKLENERYRSDTGDRKWLAEWAAITVTVWLLFVLLILLKNSDCIHLSDTVLNVLLGTTTLNVLGLMFIVLRGHFGSK